MFQAAARLHYSCNCLVGGATHYSTGHLHGMGCVLDDQHVLTARHCWEEIATSYRWPVALRHNGMFRCEIAFEDARRDLAVLRTVEKISGKDIEPVTRYPILSAAPVGLGTPVGFVSRLTLADDADAASHLHLVVSHISLVLLDQANDVQQLGLSPVTLPTAAAGSAVFLPGGEIVGVVVRHAPLRAEAPERRGSAGGELPIVAPLLPVLDELRAALT